MGKEPQMARRSLSFILAFGALFLLFPGSARSNPTPGPQLIQVTGDIWLAWGKASVRVNLKKPTGDPIHGASIIVNDIPIPEMEISGYMYNKHDIPYSFSVPQVFKLVVKLPSPPFDPGCIVNGTLTVPLLVNFVKPHSNESFIRGKGEGLTFEWRAVPGPAPVTLTMQSGNNVFYMSPQQNGLVLIVPWNSIPKNIVDIHTNLWATIYPAVLSGSVAPGSDFHAIVRSWIDLHVYAFPPQLNKVKK
jgi:hypothetical protein